MGEMSLFNLAVLAGFVFLVLEIAIPAFIMLGFAVGAFALAGLSVFGISQASVLVSTFAAVSALTWGALRAMSRRKGDTKLSETDINQY